MSENVRQVSIQKLLADIVAAEVHIHNFGELETKVVLQLLIDFSTLFQNVSVYPDHNQTRHNADALYTRMAALLSLWLSTEDIQFTQAQLFELVLCKSIINSIFYSSGFRGTDHLPNYLSTINEDGTATIHQNKLVALLIVLHIDDLSHEFLSAARKLPANYYLVLLMGWLNCKTALTARGEEIRSELVNDSELLLRLDSNQRFLDGIMNVWMLSTYYVSKNKYVLKKNINQMLSRYMDKNFGTFQVRQNFIKSKAKPKLLIIHERLTAGHAMFRCYEHYFNELNNYFDIVSMVQNEYVDDAGRALFNQTIEIGTTIDFSQILKEVQRINPDVVYYPSLGMCRWTVMLANIRLATVQVAGCGHPDSSYIDAIDYLWSCELPNEGYNQLSEICLADDLIEFRNTSYPGFNVSEYLNHEKGTDVIHLAINCSSMKLNSRFLIVLKNIIEQTNRKVQLHFFPAVTGFDFDFMEQALLKLFPAAKVYPSMPYADFMKRLSQCHISLAPFPFGNTNSTVDALLLELPVVAMNGSSPYSVTDQLVLHKVGLEKNVCNTESQYIELACRLIDDPVFLKASVENIKTAQVAEKIFVEKPNNIDASFATLLLKVVEQHKTIKKSGKKVISFKDVEMLNTSTNRQ